MSTFNGFVSEFPLIRIDHFRTLPGKSPPLACFLSHIHSDHLAGLESLKSPFVYCSSATRELLLRLEKYPHRMNFTRGILECRVQTYKHLRKLLKPLPLETPIKIELCPGTNIQVTLFDANHCLGSVMFLIEGQGKAVLYTGDIRSETWWINSLIRNPAMLPYAMGKRQMDKIYLDTTFAIRDEPYRSFPSKAHGIAELRDKISKYPDETIFYLRAWTFGYEDVWLALSNALQSPIHLDNYRYRIYTAVANPSHLADQPSLTCREAPLLAGFKLGNTHHPGILTRDYSARVHSCEHGPTSCPALTSNTRVVDITPVISRYAGVAIRELGAGGGKGDLDQTYELELPDPSSVQRLLALCTAAANGGDGTQALCRSADMVRALVATGKTSLALDDVASLLDEMRDQSGDGAGSSEIPLAQLPRVLAGLTAAAETQSEPGKDVGGVAGEPPAATGSASPLPSSITFPYARHSSYEELRALVAALRPRDIWPCTVPPLHEWDEEMSMEALFGDLCGDTAAGFAHDLEMRERRLVLDAEMQGRETAKRKRGTEAEVRESQCTTVDEDETESEDGGVGDDADGLVKNDDVRGTSSVIRPARSVKRTDTEVCASCRTDPTVFSSPLGNSQSMRLKAREEAFVAAQTGNWHTIELESLKSSDGDEELL